MSGAFFRGTSSTQDRRFGDKLKLYVKKTKFPKEYEVKIDIANKVAFDVVKKWIADKVLDIVGFEDDVLVEYIFGLLENKTDACAKTVQYNLLGFLEADTPDFVKQLWKLLISAQESGGIPREFLEQKKREREAKQAEEAKLKSLLEKRASERGEDERDDRSNKRRRWDQRQPDVKGEPVDEGAGGENAETGLHREDRYRDRHRRERDKDRRRHRHRDRDRGRDRDGDRHHEGARHSRRHRHDRHASDRARDRDKERERSGGGGRDEQNSGDRERDGHRGWDRSSGGRGDRSTEGRRDRRKDQRTKRDDGSRHDGERSKEKALGHSDHSESETGDEKNVKGFEAGSSSEHHG